MTAERDHYSVLGVAQDSPDEVIQAARKALLLKYHPDRFRGDPKEAVRRSAEINAAFEVVGNPKRRAKYDEETSVLDAEIEDAPDWREPPPPPPPRNDKQKRDPPYDPPDAGDGVEVWKRTGGSGGWLVPATGFGIVLAIVLVASGVLSTHRQPETAPSNDMMASATSPAYESNDAPVTNAMLSSAMAPEPDAAVPQGEQNAIDTGDPARASLDAAFVANVREALAAIRAADDAGNCPEARDRELALTKYDNGASARYMHTALGKELMAEEAHALSATYDCWHVDRSSRDTTEAANTAAPSGSSEIVVTGSRSTDQSAATAAAPPQVRTFTVHRAGPQ